MPLLHDIRLVAPEGTLPPGFKHPPEFLEFLLFDEAESEALGGATTLSYVWPSSLSDPYYERFKKLRLAHKARLIALMEQLGLRRTPLVPLGSENDRQYFFIADGSNGIAVTDLGEDSRVASRTHHANVLEFILQLRAESGLSRWLPQTR